MLTADTRKGILDTQLTEKLVEEQHLLLQGSGNAFET